MANRIKKLKFPKWLLVTDYELTLNQEGISEEGEPISAFTSKGKCIFSEKARRVLDKDGKEIMLFGKVIMQGDVAPNFKTIADGNIKINENTYEIHAGYRPRNPNGEVFSTEFEIK